MKIDTVIKIIAVLIALCLFVATLDFMRGHAEYVAPVASFLTVIVLAVAIYVLNVKENKTQKSIADIQTKMAESQNSMMQELYELQKQFLQGKINLTLTEKRLECLHHLDLFNTQLLSREVKAAQNMRDQQTLLTNINFYFEVSWDELDAFENATEEYLFLKSKVERLHSMQHKNVFREIVDAYPRVDRLCHDIINDVFKERFSVSADGFDKYFQHFKNISAHLLIQTDDTMDASFKSFLDESIQLKMLLTQKMTPLMPEDENPAEEEEEVIIAELDITEEDIVEDSFTDEIVIGENAAEEFMVEEEKVS